MMGLPEGRKSFKIGLIYFQSVWYNAGVWLIPTQIASHVAVASTRFAYRRRAVKSEGWIVDRSWLFRNVECLGFVDDRTALMWLIAMNGYRLISMTISLEGDVDHVGVTDFTDKASGLSSTVDDHAHYHPARFRCLRWLVHGMSYRVTWWCRQHYRPANNHQCAGPATSTPALHRCWRWAVSHTVPHVRNRKEASLDYYRKRTNIF